ncbi:MAG: aminoglycoside phosphotransferase family protein [Flavobacteriales bacterium]|nr:aminoglycoside phosphotransferase family protein [Flavobacteriales bacterium]
MELIEINKIVKQFLPTEEVIAFSIIDKGLINQTFVVSVGKVEVKQFILQAISSIVFPLYEKGLQNIILVRKELQQSDFSYSFPTPINDKYICIDEVVWRMFPFVEKSICYEKVKDKDQAFEAAKCLGDFYSSLNNFDAEQLHITLPNFHNAAFRFKELQQAIETADDIRLNKAKDIIDAINKEKNVLLKFDKLNAELPKRAVHFDAKISNFLFDKKTGKAKAIIDLDTLMPGTVLSDIGDMIRTYSNVLGEESQAIALVNADTEIIEHIIAGFLSACGNILNDEEKDNLAFSGKALTLIQCIRFLTDYLNNDSYYKTAYPEQNLVRTQNQWALYCSLKG